MPKPSIIYGSFDHNGNPIKPGHDDVVNVGYGFINTHQAHNYVFGDKETAESYLENHCLPEWEKATFRERLRQMAFPFTILEGLTVNSLRVLGTGLTLYCQNPPGSISFQFPRAGLAPLLKDARTIRQHFSYNRRIVSVDEWKITTADGFEFAVVPRYLDEWPDSHMIVEADLGLVRAVREKWEQDQVSLAEAA